MQGASVSHFVFSILALASIVAQSGGAITEMYPALREYLLDQHNHYRGDVKMIGDMRRLTYDMNLECAAKKSIDRFSGNKNAQKYDITSEDAKKDAVTDYIACGGKAGETVGQNYYDDTNEPHKAVWAWVDERHGECSERDKYMANFFKFNPEAASLQGGMDHAMSFCRGYHQDDTFYNFTQVMWAKTSFVGCSYKPGFGLLCFYSEAGNTILKMPAVFGPFPKDGLFNPIGIVGIACSSCPKDYPSCENRLCVPAEPKKADSVTPSSAPTKTTTTTTTTASKPKPKPKPSCPARPQPSVRPKKTHGTFTTPTRVPAWPAKNPGAKPLRPTCLPRKKPTPRPATSHGPFTTPTRVAPWPHVKPKPSSKPTVTHKPKPSSKPTVAHKPSTPTKPKNTVKSCTRAHVTTRAHQSPTKSTASASPTKRYREPVGGCTVTKSPRSAPTVTIVRPK